MIAVRDRRDAWVGPSSRPEYGLRASLGWWSKSNSFNESEMALFSECMLKCARKLLDTADIVREAMLRQVKGPARLCTVALGDLKRAHVKVSAAHPVRRELDIHGRHAAAKADAPVFRPGARQRIGIG